MASRYFARWGAGGRGMVTQRGKTAVLMLAFADYEALEVALACHMAYGDPAMPFFILQNGLVDYDTERTVDVAQRYAQLYPGRIETIVRRTPRPAYVAIRQALDDQLAGFEFICKVDEDAFPVAPGWLEALLAAMDATQRDGKPAAFVTPLINNNTSGFPRVLDAMQLRDDYQRTAARPHYAGPGGERRIVPATEIATGSYGSIWGMPHAARWLHERTSLQPEAFVSATRGLPTVDLPGDERYSIGCILFRRSLWYDIADDDRRATDDEGMMHAYCAKHAARLVCVQSVPFVHIAYYSQREANRDLVPRMRQLYETRLAPGHSIGLYADRLHEIEARLRWRAPKTRWARLAWLARLQWGLARRFRRTAPADPSRLSGRPA
jgi:hypothetical protein